MANATPAMAAQHDPSNVILIPVPVLIDIAIAERVMAKLAQNNPRTTPPRVVNGPSLLRHRRLRVVWRWYDPYRNEPAWKILFLL